jgi:hypothetical protein
MSKVKIEGNASGTGTLTIAAPNTNTDRTLTLPDGAGEILTNASSLPAANLTGTLPAIDGSNLTNLPGGGKVLQVVSTTKTDTFSSTATNAFTDITGLSVSITPSSTSSKIMVFVSVQAVNITSNAYFRLVRGSTAIGVGDTSGSRSSVSSSNILGPNNNSMKGSSFQFLDSPSTTAATTYKVQFITDGGPVYVNRTADDASALYTGRSQSTITVMEIAG